MRAAPAFQISLHRFGLWRGAVLALASIALAVLAAWLMTLEAPFGIVGWLATATSVALLAALAASVMRTPSVSLRWDGRAWSLGTSIGDPESGELSVAIDLGAWMLLRFTPAVPARARVVWLPVQRLGIESQWHALRCSAYSPHPAPGDDAAGGT